MLFELTPPIANDRDPPVFPRPDRVHEDPLRLLRDIVSLDIDVCGGLECGETAVAEAGLDEHRVGIFELGVPVEIVHPHTIERERVEHFIERSILYRRKTSFVGQTPTNHVAADAGFPELSIGWV